MQRRKDQGKTTAMMSAGVSLPDAEILLSPWNYEILNFRYYKTHN
jgi:hypothetical protein